MPTFQPADVQLEIKLTGDDLQKLEFTIGGLTQGVHDVRVGADTADAEAHLREVMAALGGVEGTHTADVRANASQAESEIKGVDSLVDQVQSNAKDPTELELKTGQAQRGLRGLLGNFSGAQAAALGAGAAIAGVGLTAVSTASRYGELADAVGTSTDRIQRLERISIQTGGTLESFANGQRELTLRLAEAAELGAGPAIDALGLLGVTLEDLDALTPAERMDFLVGRILEVEDKSTQLFITEELLSGEFAEQARVLSLTSAEYDNYVEAANNANVISEESIARAEELNKQWREINLTLQTVGVETIGTLIEGLSGLGEAFGLATVQATEGLQEVQAELGLTDDEIDNLRDNVSGSGGVLGFFGDLAEGTKEYFSSNKDLLTVIREVGQSEDDKVEALLRGRAQIIASIGTTNDYAASLGVVIDAERAYPSAAQEVADANAAVAQSFRDVAFEANIARQAVLRGVDRAFQTGDIEGTYAQAPGLQSSAPRQRASYEPRSAAGGGGGGFSRSVSAVSRTSEQEGISRIFGRAVAEGLGVQRSEIEQAFLADAAIQEDQALRLEQLETGTTEVKSLLDAARQDARDASELARESERAAAEQAHLDATTLADVQRYQARLAEEMLQEQRKAADLVRSQRSDVLSSLLESGASAEAIQNVAVYGRGQDGSYGVIGRGIDAAFGGQQHNPATQTTRIELDGEVLGEFVTRTMVENERSGVTSIGRGD